ncbi:helix-turn-helix transcriptional regulator [Photobacterium damselae]|uniref:helix-turn-helix transcriptional regulator n=2 Tax=Photobacterium damselae TaxID=38293 RepID=UPI003C6E8017
MLSQKKKTVNGKNEFDFDVFVQRLIGLRIGNQISQVEMAKVMGIARQTYIDIEKGKTEPRVSTLYKLANALDVDVTVLLDQKERISSFISLDKASNAQLLSELDFRLTNKR